MARRQETRVNTDQTVKAHRMDPTEKVDPVQTPHRGHGAAAHCGPDCSPTSLAGFCGSA